MLIFYLHQGKNPPRITLQKHTQHIRIFSRKNGYLLIKIDARLLITYVNND